MVCMVCEFNVIAWNWKKKQFCQLFLLSWSPKWDGPSTANFMTLCHASKQMHWFTSSEPLELFLITFPQLSLDYFTKNEKIENTVKNFQTKSLQYQQAKLVMITHAGQNFKIKNLCIPQFQRVHNLTCVEKSYFSLTSCLCPSHNMQTT
jgi:hypothetical protein